MHVSVIPAKAGIQNRKLHTWIPAFAAMTKTGALHEKLRGVGELAPPL